MRCARPRPAVKTAQPSVITGWPKATEICSRATASRHGQLARLLGRMARLLDHRVTICDLRELFADPAPLADVQYSRLMPDDVARELADDPRSAIVTLAHDPKQYDLALSEALLTKAFYVGALGSERSASAQRERLMQLGSTPSQIGIQLSSTYVLLATIRERQVRLPAPRSLDFKEMPISCHPGKKSARKARSAGSAFLHFQRRTGVENGGVSLHPGKRR